jgi:hypothetical protein
MPSAEHPHPVRLEDRPVIDRFLRAHPQTISDLCFINLLGWAGAREIRWKEHDGHLLVCFRDDDDRVKFYPPVGPDPVRLMRELRHTYHWTRVDEQLEKRVEDFPLYVLCTHSDYVYRTRDLVALEGKKYDGKRNFIRRCEKLGPEVVAVTPETAAECLAFYEGWFAALPEKSETLTQESDAIRLALGNIAALGLEGVAVRIDGAVRGFAIGDRLNDDTIVEVFEKASTAYTGLYAYLLHAFAKSVDGRYAHINREEDLGIAGLRKAKESWYPSELVKKYDVEEEDCECASE